MTSPVKCLVWDLDDTMWDGVILENDTVTPRPEALRALTELDRRGILHAVASRGDHATAATYLRAHGLLDRFAAVCVGWGDKSESVRRIARELNIGVDSLAFIDNDPLERAEVQHALPQVRVYTPEDMAGLPERPEFTPAVTTAESADRAALYRTERARKESEDTFDGTREEFLTWLGLEMRVWRATPEDLARAHELTVRTHQLNSTGLVYGMEELRELIASPDHEILVASLRDRFGDYGTIGLSVSHRRGGDSVLRLLLMSCRVMSRGVGTLFIQHVNARARAAGLRPLAEFVATPVNRVMLVTLRFSGFQVLDAGPEPVVLVAPDEQGPSARHVTLIDDSAAPAGADAPPDVLDLISRQFQRVPERTAAAVGAESVTYRQLDLESAALARRLRVSGVRPGDVVVLHARQRLSLIVGMVAALRTGAAWCVADPGHPVAHLRAVVGDTGCAAVVFHGGDAATPPGKVRAAVAVDGAAPRLIDLDVAPDARTATDAAGAATPAQSPDAPSYAIPSPHSPAYLISTSGTTGPPKNVMISRGGLASLIASRPYEPGLTAFSALRLAFDGSLMFTFHALCTGGTAVLPDADELPSAERVAALLRAHEAQQCLTTPSFYRQLLEHLDGADRHLRLLVLAGEATAPALVQRHRAALPRTRLGNEYGPTEATVAVTAHDVSGTPEGVVPMGAITAGSTAYLLDDRLQPVPTGDVGELYLGGAQLALGYAARPTTTALRFVANPFTPGQRLYRTGDLARLNTQGHYEFLGRTDGQVKIGGVRVERLAAAAVLESHPGVGQAVVVDTREALAGVDDAEVTTLTAYWVQAAPAPDGGRQSPLGARELREFCARRLVPQAVPGRFVAVDSIPLTPNGKADEEALRRLRAPTAEAMALDTDRWPTDVQREVATCWAAVLGHGDFDARDSFFDLGATSLQVLALHASYQVRWPGAVQLGQLFDSRTVAGHAELIARTATPDDDATRAPGPAVPTGRDV
ncbi:amino acid adenylation domain-containing protein [Streptomyces aureoverticillatus]|uniref:amino acid adenylation domain-containing protein n=1 Tax=Streptomyces aureoverticillatus TaxID=66871 RepID=UPI0013DCC20D|nr:amino acid adenylation domain-containing protein [Streptomyces aureoverticillatus]QIB47722.1 amino acid adenylation domain-containing protein [Streptomyces aureoverticillatus]